MIAPGNEHRRFDAAEQNHESRNSEDMVGMTMLTSPGWILIRIKLGAISRPAA
jgi:hypothetical protein